METKWPFDDGFVMSSSEEFNYRTPVSGAASASHSYAQQILNQESLWSTQIALDLSTFIHP